MTDSSLRDAVIRLAAKNAVLRPHLAGLLGVEASAINPTHDYGNGHGDPVDPAPPLFVLPPPVYVAPPEPPPPPPEPEPASALPTADAAPPAPRVVLVPIPTPDPKPTPPAPVTVPDQRDAIFLTERTQRGFDADLRPEMDRMLGLDMTRAQVAEWAKIRLRDAFRQKDTLYLVLIRHQTTFEPEERFRMSLERAIGNWADEATEDDAQFPGG